MPTERVQRQIDRLLEQAEEAIAHSDWSVVRYRAENVLRLDPENADALVYLGAANRDLGSIAPPAASPAHATSKPDTPTAEPAATHPPPSRTAATSSNGSWERAARKKVYLAHDTSLSTRTWLPPLF